jgi:hypothetical protein
MIDKTQRSNTFGAQTFRGADFGTDHCLVIAKVIEGQILPVNKRAAQKLDAERFNVKKLNDIEVKRQYMLKIVRYYELKHHKKLFEDKCSKYSVMGSRLNCST